jgi:hypothetical protein
MMQGIPGSEWAVAYHNIEVKYELGERKKS